MQTGRSSSHSAVLSLSQTDKQPETQSSQFGEEEPAHSVEYYPAGQSLEIAQLSGGSIGLGSQVSRSTQIQQPSLMTLT